jgi:hypothetical protein
MEETAMQEKERVTMGGKEIAQDDRQDMVQISDIDLTWQIWRWDRVLSSVIMIPPKILKQNRK